MNYDSASEVTSGTFTTLTPAVVAPVWSSQPPNIVGNFPLEVSIALADHVNTDATGPLTYSTSFNLTNIGLSLNASTGAVTGTVPSSVSTNITFTVLGPGGAANTSISVTVTEVDTAPVYNGLYGRPFGYIQGQIGVYLEQEFAPAFDSPNNAPMTFALQEDPFNGLTIDANTGLVSGIPGSAVNPSTNIEATNATGTTGQLIANINEDGENARWETPIVLPQAVLGSDYGVYDLSVHAGGALPITIGLVSGTLPYGMIFNSGYIFGTPTAFVPNTSDLVFWITNEFQPEEVESGLTELIMHEGGPISFTAVASTPTSVTVQGESANDNGTPSRRYMIATLDTGTPTGTQVVAGQDATGSAALWSGDVPTYPLESIEATGLTKDISYRFWVAIQVGSHIVSGDPMLLVASTAVLPPSWISELTLPTGLVGEAYSYDVKPHVNTTDAAEPIVYTSTTPLPSGMTLSSAGILSATELLAPFSAFISITATNKAGAEAISAAMLISQAVSAPVQTQAYPARQYLVNIAINTNLGSSFWISDSGAMTYAHTGTLPTGCTLSSAGQLTGTPTATGVFGDIIVTATNSEGATAGNGFLITIIDQGSETHTGSLSDRRFAALGAAGHTGDMNARMLAWLQADGATSDTLPVAWSEFLTSKGFGGHRSDGWYAYLGSLGYIQGSLPERESAFWGSGGNASVAAQFDPEPTPSIENLEEYLDSAGWTVMLLGGSGSLREMVEKVTFRYSDQEAGSYVDIQGNPLPTELAADIDEYFS